jgi:hypothetical protein
MPAIYATSSTSYSYQWSWWNGRWWSTPTPTIVVKSYQLAKQACAGPNITIAMAKNAFDYATAVALSYQCK